jgi:hypothetical protein
VLMSVSYLLKQSQSTIIYMYTVISLMSLQPNQIFSHFKAFCHVNNVFVVISFTLMNFGCLKGATVKSLPLHQPIQSQLKEYHNMRNVSILLLLVDRA